MITAFVMCILLITCMCACGSDGSDLSAGPSEGDVVILYTNDVHSYIANTEEDDNGEVHPLLNYASVAAYKKELAAEGANVLLVDAGDYFQGSAYGAMDEGETVVKLMNAAGYDLATLGNHDFDFGQFRTLELISEADFPIVSCNFYNVSDGSQVLDPYEIIEAGDMKIAFIGISTPETISSSTPVYFQNEKGEYIYDFYGSEDAEDLYECVQSTIDEVKDKADLVIAVGHLGVDPSSGPNTSRMLIANTTGLDAFIDGHSHTTIEEEIVKDKDNNDVILTQTGCYLSAIGKMTVTEGSIHTELVTGLDSYDDEVSEMTDEWASAVDEKLGEQIAVLDNEMYINDPDDPEIRIVRNHETNLGDLSADSIYYYLNEIEELDCDFAIMNGGGVRASAGPGKYTYLTSKTVDPFGNVICMVEMSGSQLRDVLEKGAMDIGSTDPDTGSPAENGGFIHAAGLQYTIDTSIPSTVKTDENDNWIAGPTGEYRVKDIKVYNREKGVYKPLETDKVYRVGGINYMLRNQGGGLTMLSDLNVIQDYILEDYLVLSEYAKSFKKGADGMPHINTENSPLAGYKGYLLDYEDPYGSGRIRIV